MQLHIIDICIIATYFIAMIWAGTVVSKKASKDLNSYFLGSNKIPWYALSLSNAGGMFDIAGTMWLVYIAFVYGLKSAFIPWVWPFFNQIFLMVYLAAWIRKSNAMTGADWMTTRFGQENLGGRLSHLVVVVFSTIAVIGFLSYGFVGIGKFAAIFLPWDVSPHVYALVITAITAIYVVQGGMMGVVLTDVVQYVIMTISAIVIAVIAMIKVSPEMLAAVTPDGWDQITFGWKLDLDWTGIMDSVNEKIKSDGWSLFYAFLMMSLFKGILVSMAGPSPTQVMQRVLAAETPRKAALMSGLSSVVMGIPRYLMIGGLTVLALAFFSPDLKEMGSDIDFELILPFAISNFIPVGLMGVLMAGMLSAHMSTTSSYLNVTPAYIVNDVYKKYFNPNASNKTYIRVSYLISVLIAIVGCVVGYYIESVDSVTRWLVSALWGGYAASIALKLHWWRFNGYGFFWGMLTGLVAALMIPLLLPDVTPIYTYPYILAISLTGCIVGTLLTKPESDELLISFYTSVNPWGWWKPIKEKALAQNPDFKPNSNFWRDAFNVGIGIFWQVGVLALPMALVFKSWDNFFWILGITLLISYVLKKNWLDKMEKD